MCLLYVVLLDTAHAYAYDVLRDSIVLLGGAVPAIKRTKHQQTHAFVFSLSVSIVQT